MSINKNLYDAKKSATAVVSHLSSQHHIGVSSDATAGTLTITARAPGSTIFEPLADAVDLDLAASPSVYVTGVIAELKFALAGDDATTVQITHAYEA